MFNKSIITSMFNDNKGINFIITTSIGVGKGINGVSFKTYVGIAYQKKGYSNEYVLSQKTDIVEFADDCLVMMVENKDSSNGRIGTMKVYLPYSVIVMVEFVKETNSVECFPKNLK